MKKIRLLGIVCGLSFATTEALYAQAQDATSKPSVTTKKTKKADEEIRVTGSRLRRSETEAATAVQVIDSHEIEASGFTNVADVVREAAVSTHGAIKEKSGRGSPGAAGSNIRGLGEEYTLVLLNGRRLPNDPILAVPDINLIPLVAVERIDIIKEGASAIYGSDAVGGVVNIITKKNFDGTHFLYSRGFTSEKGGEEQRIEAATGLNSMHGSVTLGLSWRSQSIIMARDREYSADSWSGTGNPGSYRTIPVKKNDGGKWVKDEGSKGPLKAANDCSNDELHRRQDMGGGNTTCQFNYARTASIVPKTEQLGITIDAEYQVTDDTQAYAAIRNVRRSNLWNYAAAPETFYVTNPDVVKTMTGVEAEDGKGLEINYRTVELGTRDTLVETANEAGTVGFKGKITKNWDFDLSTTKSRVHSLERGVSGYWLKSRMTDLIEQGQYNPLDPNRDPSVAKAAAYQTFGVTIGQLDQIDALVSGELVKTSSGTVQLAVGTTYLNDYFMSSNDTLSTNGEVAGSSGSNGEGRRTVKSLYAETSFPLGSKHVEGNVAARSDSYSDVGKALSPQASVKWTLTPAWMLRTTFGKGFRAPSLQALNDSGGYGYPSFIDTSYCRKMQAAHDSAGIANNCTQVQYQVNSVKSDNLKPEKTDSVSFGTVGSPLDQLDFGINFWYTAIKERIAVASDRNLQNLMKAELNGADFKSRGIAIDRNSDGTLDSITLPNTNMGTTTISGLDTNVHWRDQFGMIKPSWNLDLSYFLSYKEALFKEMKAEETIGTVGRPRWKAINTLGVGIGKSHDILLAARTTAGAEKALAEAGDLPRHSEYDTQYNWGYAERGTLSFGITNFTNAKPPIDTTANPTVNTDLYNNLGRNYYTKITQDF